MPMLVVVDRIEGGFAVIEFPNRTTQNIPLENLAFDVKAGDCLIYNDGCLVPAPEETVKRQKKIKELMKSMWNDQ